MFPLFAGSNLDEIDLGYLDSDEQVTHKLALYESLANQALREDRQANLPLLFGAAWKILDLMMEFALNRAGLVPQRRGGWTIAEKTTLANLRSGDATILGVDQSTWDALLSLYINTSEHRHCLVHRILRVDSNPLRVSGHAKDGSMLLSLSAEELVAIIACAQIVAEAVILGGADKRASEHLQYELDHLQRHTNATSLGGRKAARPTVIRARLHEPTNHTCNINFARLQQETRGRQSSTYFDVHLDFPETGRCLTGRLETMPTSAVVIDLDYLPTYLDWR